MADNEGSGVMPRALVGALVALVGVMPILAALDVPPFDQANGDAPRWVVMLAGGLFVLAGVVVWTQGSPGAQAAGYVIVIGLAAIANWVAFGPGTRACTSMLSFFGFATWRRAPDLECRIAFGLGALMMDAIVLMTAADAIRRLVGPGSWVTALERAGRAGLVVTISPLILLLVILVLARAGWEAITRAAPGGRRPDGKGG